VYIVYFSYFFFFFFSSRRRHTRWPRDWSSDVCSSDLGVPLTMNFQVADTLTDRMVGQRLRALLAQAFGDVLFAATLLDSTTASRSEERRVGKECRFRWWTDH